KSCREGMEADEMLDVLQRHALYGVPSHVERAIREWAAAYGAVRFADVRLMRCRDARTADELESHPELADWIIARLGPNDLMIRSDRHANLVRRLETMGYAPRKTI